jgi:hypothetical protein
MGDSLMYSCKNKPRPSKETSYLAQDGWFEDPDGMTRKPKMVRIKSNFDFSVCKHVESLEAYLDPQCDGCQWRKA